jgi:hypothetical protein
LSDNNYFKALKNRKRYNKQGIILGGFFAVFEGDASVWKNETKNSIKELKSLVKYENEYFIDTIDAQNDFSVNIRGESFIVIDVSGFDFNQIEKTISCVKYSVSRSLSVVVFVDKSNFRLSRNADVVFSVSDNKISYCIQT